MLINVPFADDFIATVADRAALLAREAGLPAHDWGRMLILLPNRRSVRVLQSVLVQRHGTMIPPRISPLGEPDIDEFAGDTIGDTAFPVISPTQRALVLSWLLQQSRRHSQLVGTPETDIQMALSLGRLMDRLQEHSLDLADIVAPSTEAMAAHWQWAQRVLGVVQEFWPQWLAENHWQQPIAARQQRLAAFAECLSPSQPLIIAGSLARSVAVQALIARVHTQPYARVLLQGLELTPEGHVQRLAAQSPSHPNYSLCRLLQGLHPQEKEDTYTVHASLPCAAPPCAAPFFARLVQTVSMQQSPKAQAILIQPTIVPQNIHGWVFADHHSEAMGVSLLAQQCLYEQPEANLAVISQDQVFIDTLIRHCAHFGLAVDRASGLPLAQSAFGRLACLMLEVYQNGWDVVRFLAVLKHPLTRLGQSAAVLRKQIGNLEGRCLQGYHRDTLDALWDTEIPENMRGLRTMAHAGMQCNLQGWLQHWRDDLSVLCTTEKKETVTSNADEVRLSDGQQAWDCWWRTLIDQAQALLDDVCHADQFCRQIMALIARERIPLLSPSGPAVRVLAPMEARLLRFDLVIIPQMLAGYYPPEPDTEPWLYRQFYHDQDIPPPEENQGLAAHDFVGLLHQPRVYLTRAEKQNGQMTTASLWWEKLEIAYRLHSSDPERQLVKPARQAQMRDWLHYLRYPTTRSHYRDTVMRRPVAPAIVPEHRLQRLRVSQIAALYQNPYALYVEHTLKLKPRDRRFTDIEAQQRGQLMHRWWQLWVQRDAMQQSYSDACTLVDQVIDEKPMSREFTRRIKQQMRTMLGQWLVQDAVWQGGLSYAELVGQWTLGGMIFRAKMDRLVENGQHRHVIDYKIGTPPGQSKVEGDYQWQLPLMALMLNNGGFKDTPAVELADQQLWYWSLNKDGGVKKASKISTPELCEVVYTALQQTVQEIQNGDYVFAACVDGKAPAYGAYNGLIRFAEWGEIPELNAEDNDATE